jgi:hypothetical protein
MENVIPCACGCGRTLTSHDGRNRPRRYISGHNPTEGFKPGHRMNWKGGRTVTPSGYVLLRVRAGHHLADVRGYAPEHRLVAEEKLGRRLLPGEVPHHLNGVKSDNRPENIVVVDSLAAHAAFKRLRTDLRPVGGENPTIACACGCGGRFHLYDSRNRPRRYVWGHQ